MTQAEQKTTNELMGQREQRFPWLLFLIGIAAIFELFYLLLVALSPLPGLHLSCTPLVNQCPPTTAQWSWILLPSHLLTTTFGRLVDISSRHEWFSPVFLGVTLAGLTGIYAAAMLAIHHQRGTGPTARRWLFLLLAGTLLFGLTLLFQPLLLSDDVFTYMISGRILSVYHANPLHTAPIQYPTDPYLHWVLSGRQLPNIFGPLWLFIASRLAALSNDPAISLLLFKATALLAHLINCVLVWAILSRIAPTRRLTGTLLYAWNPLILIELAGSGHNEGVLLCLLLLATWFYVWSVPVRTAYAVSQNNPAIRSSVSPDLSWAALIDQPAPTDDKSADAINRVPMGQSPTQADKSALPTINRGLHMRFASYRFFPLLFKICALLVFGLAISMNLVALLLAPLLLWFDVRGEKQASHMFWGLCWRAPLMLIPALVIFLPFWQDASTFFALTSAVDMAHFIHAPVGLLTGPMHTLYENIAKVLRFPVLVPPDVAADVTLRASTTFIFVLIYIHLFGQVRQATNTIVGRHANSHTDQEIVVPGFDILLSSWGIAVFWYMVLVSGWFWPWYLLWMLWIIILQRLRVFTSAMLVLSGTALFIYPFVGFSRAPIATYQTALIFGVPLIYMLVVWTRQRHTERTAISYGR